MRFYLAFIASAIFFPLNLSASIQADAPDRLGLEAGGGWLVFRVKANGSFASGYLNFANRSCNLNLIKFRNNLNPNFDVGLVYMRVDVRTGGQFQFNHQIYDGGGKLNFYGLVIRKHFSFIEAKHFGLGVSFGGGGGILSGQYIYNVILPDTVEIKGGSFRAFAPFFELSIFSDIRPAINKIKNLSFGPRIGVMNGAPFLGGSLRYRF